MSEASKAVFLSYASQDAEAATRIAGALRQAGVEVWFDRSELRGGDSWDAKIRKQIKECALFVPIISAHTQARAEGYFRLEWKLAVDRSHLMADDAHFLLPVVIDDTRDATARVPDKFRDVQWVHLNVKDTPETLALRVGKLLRQEQDAGGGPQAPEAKAGPVAAKGQPAWLRFAWAGVGILFAVFYALRPAWQPAPRPAEPKPAAVSPAPRAGQVTAARKLALQAETLIWDLMAVRENFRTADDLCKRALALDSTDAEIWAISALVSDFFIWRGYDRSVQRQETARSQAEHALALDPQSIRAGHVQAASYMLAGDIKEALRLMRALADRAPTNRTVLWGLAIAEQFSGNEAGVRAALARLHNLPGRDAESMGVEAMLLTNSGRYPEAEAVLDDLLKDGNYAVAYYDKLEMLTIYWADFPAARAFLAKIPARLMQQDAFAAMAAELWLMAQEGDKALEVLDKVPREYLEEYEASEPKSNLAGWAHQVAGRHAAAQAEWRKALALVEGRLAAEPTDPELLLIKAKLQAQLGLKAEARETWRLRVELGGSANPPSLGQESLFQVLVGDTEAATATLVAGWPDADFNFRSVLSTRLRYAPELAPIRDDPRIRKLVAEHVAALARLRNGKPGGVGSPADGVAHPDEKSVAVLAFANLSDDKGNEYFSDGISEELLNVLTKVPGLKVTARTSSFHFKGKDTPVPEIARQLGVAYVVEGSVRKAGDKVRITAQLIKAADGFQVWSDTFTRDLQDIFAVQDEIAGLIAKNLSLRMGVSEARPVAVNTEAYQHLFQARFYSRQDNNEGWLRSVAECQAALAIEPDFALAAAEMARSYIQLARFGGISAAEGYRLARGPAEHALAVDPNLAEANNAIGWVQRTADWNWPGADASFRRAYELAPRNATMIRDYAIVRGNQGFLNEARTLAAQALELDPLNASTRGHYALFLTWGDARLDEATVQLQRALELSPAAVEWHSYLSRILVLQGRLDEAATVAELEPSERYRLVGRALVLAARKDRSAMERVLHDMEEKFPEAMSYYIAEVYSYAGDNDRAFDWLERARQQRDTALCWILGSPANRAISQDPRWPVFLKKIGHDSPGRNP